MNGLKKVNLDILFRIIWKDNKLVRREKGRSIYLQRENLPQILLKN